jgi:formate dehydrogenase iron-sulfur subunit
MSALNHPTCSRRTFLKKLGAGAAAVTLTGVLQAPAASASEAPSGEESFGILIDLTRCTGCQSCALACKQANELSDPTIIPIKLDTNAYSYVEELPGTTIAGDASIYVKHQCMNCLHPACVSACTVGALRKTPEGPVTYDGGKCFGCRYCQYACPFGVPAYEWENPLGLIHKCQFCNERLSEGEGPACVEACPNGALRFGQREHLLAQARAQIESNPGRYVKHIYGEHEAGGTAMLYLSAVPFSQLDFPELGPEPIPRYAEAVMKQTPVIALTVASVASGLSWFFQRRARLAQGHLVNTQQHTEEVK